MKSFEFTWVILLGISILTGLRSLNDTHLTTTSKLSLQLSTLVTVIAFMHYTLMLKRKTNIILYRYMDWVFTTPLLLIDYCLIEGITDINFIIELILYNWSMLGIGILGEYNIINQFISMVGGFVPFTRMFWLLHKRVQHKKRFIIFTTLWGLYGITHIIPSKSLKNMSYNILDMITKGMFGLYIYSLSYNTHYDLNQRLR